MTFHLYMLLNTQGETRYPYVAISSDSHRMLHISDDHIAILPKADSDYYEGDYIPTSRNFDLDLLYLDSLVEDYTGEYEYSLVTRFNADKHMTLTYQSPTNERPKDYDIYATYPNPRARQFVRVVYPIMDNIRQIVSEII